MSLLKFASSVAKFVKVRAWDKEVIDTFDFRLHYRFTSAFLFLASILCTATSFLGDPITCIVDNEKIKKAVTTYCWITSTFTVPRLKGGRPGVDVAAYNVGPYLAYEESVVHHNYYQWVPFVLVFQGLMFYAPHWLWKKWEGGLISNISEGLRGPKMDANEETRKNMERVVLYFTSSWRMHTMYCACYTFCVALNVINTFGNIFLMNKFLGGTFLDYGTKVLQLPDQEFRTDPMADVFPKITKCTFHKYGPSGGLQVLDVMCVLALNILNEKIYIFLWFWLIILAVISSLGLLYTLAIMLSPKAREIVFKRGFKISRTATKSIATKLSAGDFLVLHFLGQSIRAASFTELLDQLSANLNDKHSHGNQTPPLIEMSPLYPHLPKTAA
ncbi:innexin inx3-like [Schistocerca gregaria]|uniref:innexin inx3-like n=1 Tax=Schistocerca gregaria TaxID=7010 RepID=UPI00211DF644|nr:innexin inx3-like [Schistocerca gregaria]